MEELTLMQACRLFDIPDKKLSALIRSGDINAYKKSGRYVIPQNEIARLKQEFPAMPLSRASNRALSEEEKIAKIKEFQDFAHQKGGTCLSDVYVSSKAPIKFKCKEGHVWESNSSNIKLGRWCKKCSDKKLGIAFGRGYNKPL